VHFARSLPRLRWQPSDLDPELRRSTSLWIRHEALSNVSEPIALDIMRRPWPIAAADAIVCINVLHVSPWESGLALLEGARDSLAPGGVLFLYGPYRWRNLPTAPSNEKFDADLRAHDPAWGLREAEAVAETAAGNGLALVETVAMPANNLSLIFRR
jgi:hypothetical protein